MEIPTETKNLIQTRIGEIREQYPEAQAACLPALHVAQDHLNHVTDDVLDLTLFLWARGCQAFACGDPSRFESGGACL